MGKIKQVVDIIMENFEVTDWWRGSSPFELLIGVILSQKTNWKNVRKALERFRAKFRTVKDVAESPVEEIEKAIRPAGLYRVKAARISKLAKHLVDERGSRLEDILKMPYSRAKMELMKIEGIGPKTADVFLMFARNEQVLPVDTHILRIMKRLGVADKTDYESLRAKLEAEIEPHKRLKAHIALIEFGRKICKAANPLCDTCPVKNYCLFRSNNKTKLE